MNISTVAENLRTTIAGKEDLRKRALKTQNDIAKHLDPIYLTGRYGQEALVDKSLSSVIGYLETNINEFKLLLEDVEKCVDKELEQPWW